MGEVEFTLADFRGRLVPFYDPAQGSSRGACRDLAFQNFTSANPLTPEGNDRTTTGAFSPSGATTKAGEVIEGAVHPGGEAGLGPAINDKPFPEFLKKFQVRHGLGTMPSFSEQKISDEQLEDLMEYLNALRRSRRLTSAAPDQTRERAALAGR